MMMLIHHVFLSSMPTLHAKSDSISRLLPHDAEKAQCLNACFGVNP